MTLTVDANRFPSPARAAREMVRAFARLRRRIVNRYNIKHLAYFVTVEATKQGWPHMHIALRSKWIGQRWLSEQWADLLGSPIVDIRRVQDGGRAARYLAKYLGKDPHRFEGCKRFWCSRDWNDSKHPEPPAPACFGDRWWRRSESLAQLEAVCLARGCATVLTAHSLTWEAGFP
jgi:hypothetical protein